MLGLESRGQVFRDRFLIADVRMDADFPTERWFWFDPPFHPGRSVLLHRQADNVWRIDFQLGWEADPEAEKQPERVIPRIAAMLGSQYKFALEWVSVYTFQCRRMERLLHGRVVFAGDAAHQVSPFGARGANSGMQDADNLVWKLDLVLKGSSPEALLETYDSERGMAARENISHSTRSTDFITPKSSVSRVFRDAVLELARQHEFARRLVNSGRLSTPTTYVGSSLNTEDRDAFRGACIPGAPSPDAPVRIQGQPGWLLQLLGGQFVGIYFAGSQPVPSTMLAALQGLERSTVPVKSIVISDQSSLVGCVDSEGLAKERLDARVGTYYLFRPDQHVAGRWRTFEPAVVRDALARATGAEVVRRAAA
jgi:3-(3-hydroxy-phenyl)propionate hydroxylase